MINKKYIENLEKNFQHLQKNYSESDLLSARAEQQKFRGSEDSRYYEYVPCPLCSEDKYKIFHTITDFKPRERKYNKVLWKDLILVLSTKIIGVKNTSSLLSYTLGENIDLANLGYTVVQCTNCGLFYRNPIYSNEKIVNAYNRGYLKFLAGDYGKDRVKTYDNVLNKLGFEDKTNHSNTKRILDIGCGHGLFLQYIQKKGWDPYGTDFAEDCIEYAREELGLTNTRVGNLDESSYEENFFDAVTLWSVAAHLNDPNAMFKNIYKILKDEGILIVYTVNAGGLQHMTDLNCWRGFTANHLIFFTKETIEYALKKAGFSSVEFANDERDFKQLLNDKKIAMDESENIKESMDKKLLGDMLLVMANK